MREDVRSRQARIMALLEQRREMSPADLASAIGVSSVTVRRDVAALAEAGRITRAHGKVALARRASDPRAPGAALAPFSVGLLMPRADYYYGDVIRAVTAVIARAGGRVILGVSGDRSEQDTPQLQALLDANVSGIIATPNWPDGVGSDEATALLAQTDLPVVLVERRGAPGSRLELADRVCTDHAFGARAAVDHLYSSGWRDVVVVLQPTPTSAQLHRGFVEAMRLHGREVTDDMMISSSPPENDPTRGDSIAELLHERWQLSGPFAVLVHNDLNALMIMQRLQSRGVRVPQDIGFVAYDDETAELADVPLTAVAPPKSEVGRLAAERMIERLRERSGLDARIRTIAHVDLLPTLNERASSRFMSN